MNFKRYVSRVLRHPAFLLWFATMAIWGPWLGNVPLRDWDEGTIASVAHSTMGQNGIAQLLAVQWGEPYFNKPPGLHWLIGWISHHISTDNWAIRLGPAVISSLAVPLIVLLRTELEPLSARHRLEAQRTPRSAWIAGVILMTLLPMARHGRLAMLDGSLITSALLLFYGQALAARQCLAGVFAGLGISALLLLKPPAVLGYLCISLVWQLQQPRANVSRAFPWLVIGALPGITWHLWHWYSRGSIALVMWGSQGLARLSGTVEGNAGSGLNALIEIAKGGWPWLLFLPTGLVLAWKHRKKAPYNFELYLLAGTCLMVLPLKTQLPWYSHLFWPPIALLCAESVEVKIRTERFRWTGVALLLLGWILIGTALASSTFRQLSAELPVAAIIFAGGGLVFSGHLFQSSYQKQRQQGLAILAATWSIGLVMLWHSKLWNWEINETWSPIDMGEQIQALPLNAKIYHRGPDHPALEWYSKRKIARLKNFRSNDTQTFYLISDQIKDLERCDSLQKTSRLPWKLLKCPPMNNSTHSQNTNTENP